MGSDPDMLLRRILCLESLLLGDAFAVFYTFPAKKEKSVTLVVSPLKPKPLKYHLRTESINLYSVVPYNSYTREEELYIGKTLKALPSTS